MDNVAMAPTARNCNNHDNPQNKAKVYYGHHQWLKILHYVVMDLIMVDQDAREIRKTETVSETKI